ncbi:MAG: hypothetical protein ACOVOR_03015 [Rhabdochlamydiaceae bacterium]
MTLNEKVFSIPPFISVSWQNIYSLSVDFRLSSPLLVVYLTNSQIIEIPNLESEIIEKAFQLHQTHLEKKEPFDSAHLSKNEAKKSLNTNSQDNPLMDWITHIYLDLQHDQSQKMSNSIPQELAEKINQLSKTLGLDLSHLSLNHENCDCLYCQINSSLNNNTLPVKDSEEIVSDEDLKFREWDITTEGQSVYKVHNPSDSNECYTVYLGDPIGCTCGAHNCEHIKAVLEH